MFNVTNYTEGYSPEASVSLLFLFSFIISSLSSFISFTSDIFQVFGPGSRSAS